VDVGVTEHSSSGSEDLSLWPPQSTGDRVAVCRRGLSGATAEVPQRAPAEPAGV